MPKSFTFGRISGIPLKIHINWIVTAVLVTWSLAGGYFPINYPNREPGFYWLLGTITSMLFFVSVLLHELGHAIVAVREGVAVRSITLFVFGGVAHISREPSTPKSEFKIVAAGPLTSLALAGLFYLISLAASGAQEISGVSRYLAQINLILALFNLIPGFPLDGGRLLRAGLWAAKRDFRWATRWATNIGLLLAGLSIAAGLGIMLSGFVFNGVWIIFIGWYLSHMARESYKQSVLHAPWRTMDFKFQPDRLASIAITGRPRNYRTAVVRVDVVNHSLMQGIPATGGNVEEESNRAVQTGSIIKN